MSEKIQVTNDFAFQFIFGRKGNEEILKSFLEAVLKRKIDEVEIIEDTKLERKLKSEKLGILDVKARFNDGVKVNVEMQMINKRDMVERTLFYWSKLYVEGINEGEEYKDFPQTITINILNYHFLPDNQYHLTSHIYFDKFKEEMLTDKLEIHFIDLAKFRKNVTEVEEELSSWLAFIEGSRGEMVQLAKDKVKEIEKAIKKLETLKEDGEAYRIYELRQKHIRDSASEKATGRAEGREEGQKETRLEIAKKLLKDGMSIEKIIELTNVSNEELKEVE